LARERRGIDVTNVLPPSGPPFAMVSVKAETSSLEISAMSPTCAPPAALGSVTVRAADIVPAGIVYWLNCPAPRRATA
jgi:hypothetical protein